MWRIWKIYPRGKDVERRVRRGWFESNENKGKIVKNQQAALMEHLKEWDEMGDARERRDR